MATRERSAVYRRFDQLPAAHQVNEEVERLEARTNELAIFTVGRAGAGKTQLLCDILGSSLPATEKPKPATGMRPGTKQTTEYKIQVGRVNVSIYDTRGMWDACATGHEHQTATEIREKICNGQGNGILIVCLEMHERLNFDTIRTLSLIHTVCGEGIWRFAVIALTKADKYPSDRWLRTGIEPRKWWHMFITGPILRRHFLSCLENARNYIKEIFTSTTISNECQIGMSEDEFDRLNIPIVPTSTLDRREVTNAMDRMVTVGYEKWFDTLLTHCCTRETGLSLIDIHSSRCSFLSKSYRLPEIVDKEEYDEVYKIVASKVTQGVCFVTWKIYWTFYYSSRINNKPRFMPAKTSRK